MSKTFDDKNFTDTVISTRIRFARNLKDTPFPSRLTQAEKIKLNNRIKDAVLGDDSPIKDMFRYVDMDDLPTVDAEVLACRHLISPDFADNSSGRALLISNDETISIMLCEEDHIRLQVICPGMDLENALKKADRIDTLLDERLGFAFDKRLGYLTECPTNLGTGMRASLMLHLPMMSRSGSLRELSSAISKVGLTLRGAYGEGSKPSGDLYQLSNQITLGISEAETLDNLRTVAMQIIENERKERSTIDRQPELQDLIFRSLGILRYARLISTKEFMDEISLVRLGINAGLIDDISLETVEKLICDASAPSLTKAKGVPLSAGERDSARATLCRSILKSN